MTVNTQGMEHCESSVKDMNESNVKDMNKSSVKDIHNNNAYDVISLSSHDSNECIDTNLNSFLGDIVESNENFPPLISDNYREFLIEQGRLRSMEAVNPGSNSIYVVHAHPNARRNRLISNPNLLQRDIDQLRRYGCYINDSILEAYFVLIERRHIELSSNNEQSTLFFNIHFINKLFDINSVYETHEMHNFNFDLLRIFPNLIS